MFLYNNFINKMALGLCIQFIDLSTSRNIEETPYRDHRQYRTYIINITVQVSRKTQILNILQTSQPAHYQ
jgi:hypothetical protein